MGLVSLKLLNPEIGLLIDLGRYLSLGPFFGPILCCIMAVQHWFLFFLDLWSPRDELDMVAEDWSKTESSKVVSHSTG